MSPHVGNFTQELVEMAKAAEALPQVQHELRLRDNELSKAKETIASREIHILQLKEDIDRLHAKLREAEVAKDAAETMFLEADDRTTRALEFIKATFGNAGSLIQALEPPKPAESVVEQGQSEPGFTSTTPSPTSVDTASPKPEPQPLNWPEPSPVFPTQPTPEPLTQPLTVSGEASSGHSGQSEPDPTVSKETGIQTNAAPTTVDFGQSVSSNPSEVGQSAVHPTADATQITENTSVIGSDPLDSAKPFLGIRYHDYPDYVTLNRWLAGGGTEADYLWRPGKSTVI